MLRHAWYHLKKEETKMHWTERRRAKASIAEELARRGWALYGYKPDRSDGMTDYYDPASWDGIAEKNGFVVVVDVGKSNNCILSRSGGRRYTERVRDEDCEHCAGTGQEPGGWTYEDACADQKGYRRWVLAVAGVVMTPVLGSAVDARDFKDGRYRCRLCHGAGHTWKEVEAVEPWPVFCANEGGRLWHVEREGRILASGVGLGPCADYDRQRAQAAVEQLVNRIEDALHTRPVPVGAEATTAASDVAVTIRHNQAHNGIEVVFASKPALEVREALKALGFRWSQRQGLWYTRYADRTWQRVHALLEDEAAATGEPEAPVLPEPGAEPAEPEAPTETPHYVIEEPLTGQIIGGAGGDPGEPEPEPWQMTRLAYQESRAVRVAGGVPILNARDGREHEAAVRQAAAEGLPVPPRVLAEYGLGEADVLEVVDVYGRPARVSRYDYALGRIQLRLYCQTTATLLADLPTAHEARRAQGGAVTLHRDNIAQVLDRRLAKHSRETSSGDLDLAQPRLAAEEPFAWRPEPCPQTIAAAAESLQPALFPTF